MQDHARKPDPCGSGLQFNGYDFGDGELFRAHAASSAPRASSQRPPTPLILHDTAGFGERQNGWPPIEAEGGKGLASADKMRDPAQRAATIRRSSVGDSQNDPSDVRRRPESSALVSPATSLTFQSSPRFATGLRIGVQ
jgi:hypothetical protein